MSHSNSTKDAAQRDRQPLGDSELDQLRSCLNGLRFGSVTIIVQDGCIVQIDRTEKRRLRGPIHNGARTPQNHSDANTLQ